jgi:restriction system protein
MAIPDYQEIMLPLLEIAGDGGLHSVAEAIERLSEKYRLTDDDRRELLPSGTQHRFDNRVYWARTYLKQAGLLNFPERGQFQITGVGKGVLADKPPRIDVKFLERFPVFLEFRKRRGKSTKNDTAPSEIPQSPEESLEENYQILNDKLVADLLVQVKAASPRFFENLVIDLLVGMGYGGSRRDAGRAVGRSGDGGIDGIIKEDKLGLDVIYVQAKRWEATVGRPVVQAFAGYLEGVRAKRGILITTSGFSSDARHYVENIEKKIVLIDGEDLANLMIEHDIAVSTVAEYQVKKIDNDYFTED